MEQLTTYTYISRFMTPTIRSSYRRPQSDYLVHLISEPLECYFFFLSGLIEEWLIL